jgi:hypothetical protein
MNCHSQLLHMFVHGLCMSSRRTPTAQPTPPHSSGPAVHAGTTCQVMPPTNQFDLTDASLASTHPSQEHVPPRR